MEFLRIVSTEQGFYLALLSARLSIQVSCCLSLGHLLSAAAQ